MKHPVLLRRLVVLIVTGVLGCAAAAVTPSLAHAGNPPAFSTGILPPAPGLGLAHNEDGEPGMAVDGGGTIWVASDISPYAADDPRATATGVLSGSDVWKSTDHGQSYQWVSDPFAQVQAGQPGAGGEDTDIAASPVANSSGCYDIWVASLWIGSTSLAVSQDCGATWTVIPVNGVPAQDRPWLAADGACTVYLSYHALAPYDTVVDQFSLPPCSGQAVGSAVDPTQAQLFAGNIAPGLTNRFGKLVVDTSPASAFQHHVYEPMQGCTAPTPTGTNPEAGVAGCATNAEIFVGVSSDGITWTNSLVHVTNGKTLFIWPATAAVDRAGDVYVAWMEGDNGYAQRAYISVSKNAGATWSTPVQVNAPPSMSAAYPTVAADTAGHVEAAWYGTSANGGTADVTVMGEPHTTLTSNCGGSGQPACTPATWQLWWGNSTDYGQTWTQSVVTDTVHTGVLCVEGGGCGVYTDDRTLLDDFGLTIDPHTGGATMVFNNDQPGGTGGKAHTDFATQAVAPQTGTPELPVPSLALMLATGATAAFAASRRRTRRHGGL